MQNLTKNISTEHGANEFQVRLLKEDGVGLLTTKNEEHYLILDSIDYWYDLIQSGYPKKKKCSCKNDWFYVAFKYLFRQASEEVREIQIFTTCTQCNKVSNPMSIDIDYLPTEELIANPIGFCQQPNIKYQFQELTCFWSGDHLKDFLQFIFQDLHLNVYCWFFQRPDNKRRFEMVSFDKAMQIITANAQYLNFYFSATAIDTAKYTKQTDDNGVYLKDGIWRRDEIIQLSAPYSIFGHGLLYYINFCNQYIDKGKVIDKSAPFALTTTKLKTWLKENFVSSRGKNCFDGQEA